MKTNLLLLIAGFLICTVQAQEMKWKGKSVDFSHGKLKVSDNRRFLVFEDGTPFFLFGRHGMGIVPSAE